MRPCVRISKTKLLIFALLRAAKHLDQSIWRSSSFPDQSCLISVSQYNSTATWGIHPMASSPVPFNSVQAEARGCAMEVDVKVDATEAEEVTEQEAKQELDRLLSDPQFHSTDRNRNFLRF